MTVSGCINKTKNSVAKIKFVGVPKPPLNFGGEKVSQNFENKEFFILRIVNGPKISRSFVHPNRMYIQNHN